MTLIEFIEANILSDNPLITSVTLGILFTCFCELYHTLFTAVFTMFRKQVYFMASLTILFNQFSSWMTSLVSTMTADGNEIMLIPVGVFVCGAIIGLAKRLIGNQLEVFYMEGANNGMESLSTLFTTFTGWMGDLVSTIVGQPLLLIPVGIFCVGAVIGLAKRLIGQKNARHHSTGVFSLWGYYVF